MNVDLPAGMGEFARVLVGSIGTGVGDVSTVEGVVSAPAHGYAGAVADLGREYEGVVRGLRARLEVAEASLSVAAADRDMFAAAVDDQRAVIATLEADLRVLAGVARDAREHTARHGTTSRAWEGLREILNYPGSADALARAQRVRMREAARLQPNPLLVPVRS